ncbi:aminoacyl-tRNA synthetase [Noviherbaspirillum pedocola]|uniref:Aminoacyl-tRNA synthetase n=1 Tax=Noviherbaspirillum pedocola TaxID=2801341 RepID=A0A934W919_9BURK|nr:aminoacyl-tRNA synthetase [Noviherbaspirillum pedocola]MBK4737503.1 aminoacyl-tRNA synthetase [Noviherbaspirillum pedocola]
MRMSDQEYFRSCVARERHLAHLLGHNVEEFYEDAGTLWDGTTAMPKWTRDWAACAPLIVQHEIPIRFDREPGAAHAHCVHAGPVSVHVCDHPDLQHALMYAVVKAVIFYLEHPKAPH